VELAAINREHVRLMAAVSAGEQVSGLLEALRALERRRPAVEARRSSIAPRRGLSVRDGRRLRDELLELAADRRRVLVDDPTNARAIVSSLLVGRVTFTALDDRQRWRVDGEGTIAGLFSRVFSVTAVGSTSPRGPDALERVISGEIRAA
jgi:hypothetical protein